MDGVPRFALDRSLGRLARWLRRLGFDAFCRPEVDLRGLLTLAAREQRVLVTRSPRRPLHPARVARILLRADGFRDQLRELDRHYPLGGWEARPPRCRSCNVTLVAASPEAPARRCPRCRRIVPSEDHDARMAAELEALSLRRPEAL